MRLLVVCDIVHGVCCNCGLHLKKHLQGTRGCPKTSDCRQGVCCRIERRQQFVTRRVRLPESADMSKITAKMDNGTIVIDVPKNPDKVRQRQIDVS